MSEAFKNNPSLPPAAPNSGPSLIERAMNEFDRRQFTPPPVPSELIPPVVRAAAAFPAEAPVAAQPAPNGAMAAEKPVMAHAPRQVAQFFPIDQQSLADQGFTLPGSRPSAQVEEFRLVKRQLLDQVKELRRQGAGAEAQAILVSSALPGEGKTFCAINLALSIAAERDSEVVLVDLDLACASVLNTLGVPNGPGFIDALVDPARDVRDLLIETNVQGLAVLPGGNPTSSDSEYLASAQARAVLAKLVEGHPKRIVLFDTPPVLATSIAAEAAKLCGQVIMVVKADKTAGSAVQDAAGLLSGCPNVQALLNGVRFSPSGRRFGTYHSYRG